MSVGAELLVAIDPLVGRFARNREALAQIRDDELPAFAEEDELVALFHRGGCFPGHPP
jgi:hypothetical protein